MCIFCSDFIWWILLILCRYLESWVLYVLRILFMRFLLLDFILRKLIIFYGFLNLVVFWEVWRRRGFILLSLVMLEIERICLIILFVRWFKVLFVIILMMIILLVWELWDIDVCWKYVWIVVFLVFNIK